MRTIFISLALVFSAIASYAQVELDSASTISGERAQQLHASDFNGNSLDELVYVVKSFPHDYLMYRKTSHSILDETDTLISPTEGLGDILFLKVLDVDADTDLDIAVALRDSTSDELWVLENDGAGTFTRNQISDEFDFISDLSAGDFNGDQQEEIIVIDHTQVVVFYEVGTGTVRDTVVFGGPEMYAITVADFNQDGYDDFAIGVQGYELFTNNNQGDFTITDMDGFGITFGVWSNDFNQDGFPDLYSWSHAQGLVSFENDGLGGLDLRQNLNPVSPIRDIAFIDLDNDGDEDLVTTEGQLEKIIYHEAVADSFIAAYADLHQASNGLLYHLTAVDVNGDGNLSLAWGDDSLNLLLRGTDQPLTISPLDPVKHTFTVLYDANGNTLLQNHAAIADKYYIYSLTGALNHVVRVNPGEVKPLHAEGTGIYIIKSALTGNAVKASIRN